LIHYYFLLLFFLLCHMHHIYH